MAFMNFINLPEDLHKALIDNSARLEMENKKLRDENEQLKKMVEKMRKYLQALHDKNYGINGMGRYIDDIRNGFFKPRLNKDVNEQTVLRTILKLKTTDMKKVAEELNTSYSTIRRRLIDSKLYPINLQDIKDYYIMFYAPDSK